ncbi:MAG: SMP-30/gluconolactonase/LRE family protein [Bryobacteraceae bacterium]|jgi:sugar lactone lactonase YvrE
MRQCIAEPWYRPSTEELRYLPECPRLLGNFPGDAPVLGWVAIEHGPGRGDGSLNLLDLATRLNTSIALPGRPGFFVETTRPGTLLVGMERELVLVNGSSGEIAKTGIAIPGNRPVIINEGIAIPNGLVFGTKHELVRDPVAALYHFDCATRAVREIVGDQVCSNGKYFRCSGDGLDLIDIDSLPKTITWYRFTLGFRELLARRLLLPPSSLPALPDGLRATPDGESIVVAFYNPEPAGAGIAQELRLTDGAVLTEWILPGSPRVTCPEFVEIDGSICVLFTTAVEDMSADAQKQAPHAGSFFCGATGLTRLPAPPPLFPVESLT